MRMKDKVHDHYKSILNDVDYKNVLACNFLANNGLIRKRVYLADVMGLDWTEHKNCHVVLSLYYDTHLAMSIPFATKQHAWDYVKSKGKNDKRIIEKHAVQNGWSLKLKNAEGK